jgi:hypothetical protein
LTTPIPRSCALDDVAAKNIKSIIETSILIGVTSYH